MKRIATKINFVFLLLIAFCIPFSIQEITYFIGGWIFTWFFTFPHYKEKSVKRKIVFFLPIIYFLFILISVVYSNDKNQAWLNIQTQLTLLIFPIILLFSPDYVFKNKRYVLFSFILGLLIFSLIFLVDYLIFKNSSIVENYSSLRLFHHSYQALFVILGITILFDFLYKEIGFSWLIICGIAIFAIVIFLLDSRAGILVMIIVFLFYVIKYTRARSKLYKILSITVLFVLTAFLVINTRLAKNINVSHINNLVNSNTNNIIENGNFKQGFKYWNISKKDTLTYEIYNSTYGNALRYDKLNGNHSSYLLYRGRKINYYKDALYKFKLKYRVIKGDDNSFKIGWVTNDKPKYIFNGIINKKSLEEDWFELTIIYNNISEAESLGSIYLYQKPQSIIEYADIKMNIHDNLNRPIYKFKFKDIRIYLWKYSIELFRNNLLFGVGIGDNKDELIKHYNKNELTVASGLKYNSHNQFLETATQTGIIGLVVLLLVFAIPLYQSIKKKQELLFLFLIICFINFLFESMLERLAGVVFFAFWYSFLWFVYYKDIEDKESIPAP
ncbi:MAG: hypothetical protein GQ564_03360 [Bacteroidales bacterium]|nr:hypothetical protein [Bacteroidales bacterium]